jgi:hypothetical protein
MAASSLWQQFQRNDRHGARFEVEDGITSGDYLEGFLRGSRSALYEKGRELIITSIPQGP